MGFRAKWTTGSAPTSRSARRRTASHRTAATSAPCRGVVPQAGDDEKGVPARMESKKQRLVPNQCLHVASVIALADSTCGFATMFNLPEGAEGFTTIDMVGTINPFIVAFIVARLPLMVAS